MPTSANDELAAHGATLEIDHPASREEADLGKLTVRELLADLQR